MAIDVPYAPGKRVRVTQQIMRLDRPEGGTATGVVEGTVVGFEQAKTGSWYAHSRDKKLWLDRLTLRKEDGELVVVNLDQFSRIDLLDE
ncbi:MAG: hypothetical protein HUU18_00020 [Phycisphaerales bacterium]|nr:hypothetical protein [Phycisphaerales bacterium]